MPGISLIHMQNLALGPVELPEECTGLPLKAVKLDGELSPLYGELSPLDGELLQCAIGKLAEGALNPTAHVANKDVRQCQSQH